MKIQYRERTLIEQMNMAIELAGQPIAYFELTQAEFQSVFNSLDKNKTNAETVYSYKGISIKVVNE